MIGIHSAPADGPHKEELIEWVRGQPGVPVCIVNDVPFAKKLKDAGALAFFRTHPDGVENLYKSTDDMLARYRDGCEAGLIAIPWCEVGISHDIIAKMVTVSTAFWQRGWWCAPGDFQTGIPSETQYDLFLPLVEAINAHRDRAFLTMNQYFALTPFTGMAPLEQAYTWHKDAPLPPGAALPWHCGRHRWLWKLLDERHIPHPPLAIIEVNSAGLSDIATWQKSQPANPPCEPGYGWKSCFAAWDAHYPGQDHDQLFADMLIWLDKMIYTPDGVTCSIVYRWEDERQLPDCSPSDWERFSVYGSKVPALLKEYNQILGGPPVSPPIPPITPPPASWADATLTVDPRTSVNLRAAATTTAPVLAVIPEGVFAVSLDTAFPPTLANSFAWSHVIYNGLNGYLASSLSSVTLTPGLPPTDPALTLAVEAAYQSAIAARDAAQEAANSLLPYIP